MDKEHGNVIVSWNKNPKFKMTIEETDKRSDSDLSVTGNTVNVPAGYYEKNASKTVPGGDYQKASGVSF